MARTHRGYAPTRPRTSLEKGTEYFLLGILRATFRYAFNKVGILRQAQYDEKTTSNSHKQANAK